MRGAGEGRGEAGREREVGGTARGTGKRGKCEVGGWRAREGFARNTDVVGIHLKRGDRAQRGKQK